ncbi:MAG: heme-binding domain-containing protein [Bryobacteraceae bacterium]
MAQANTKWKLTLTCAPLLFAALQFLPAPSMVNPPGNPAGALGAHLPVPPHVARILDRSCMDCHGNRTRWPWYSRVAPASWVVASDVNNARAVLNFSEWDPDLGPGLLAAACVAVQSGNMPKQAYVLLHPEARLSPEDRRQFCAWTKTVVRPLVQAAGANTGAE